MAKGKVYLIGAGPGRPDLITVRGFNILRAADVVIYDYLVDRQLAELARPGAQLICGDRLGEKRHADGFLKDQDRINKLIIKFARQGKKVVRLRNGDATIFSRISEEMAALNAHNIEFEIVPGVTAASAAAAYAGIPLTSRQFASSVIFVTGHEDPQKKESSVDWGKVAEQGTIVLYMAVENISEIAAKLMRAGKSPRTPAAAVAAAGSLTQRAISTSLGKLAAEVRRQGITAPAIFIIGKAAALEKKFNWLRRSRRVLFTGLAEERFFEKGRTYFHLPLIKIEPWPDYRQFDRQLRKVKEFDWLIFSSRYGVEYFFQRLLALGLDGRALSGLKIAAVGQSTARKLLTCGVRADLAPVKESAAGLLNVLRKVNLKGRKVFLPRSDLADKGLTEGLTKLGAAVTTAVAYRNVPPLDLPEIDLTFFDEIYFTSPSTARNFRARYGRVPPGVKISWIGDVTKKELARLRLR